MFLFMCDSGKKHKTYYRTPRDGGLSFSILHYAGSVIYDVGGVLEKNRDTLPNSILYNMKSKLEHVECLTLLYS